jgi:hypothetical protein
MAVPNSKVANKKNQTRGILQAKDSYCCDAHDRDSVSQAMRVWNILRLRLVSARDNHRDSSERDQAQSEMLTQGIEQRYAGIEIESMAPSIDSQRHVLVGHRCGFCRGLC